MPALSRRKFLTASAALAAGAATRLARADDKPDPKVPPMNPAAPAGDATKLADGNNRFALELYGQLRKDAGNLFLSPFSISTALAMTAAGAKGATLEEMRKVLHLPPDPHPAFAELLKHVNGTGPADKRPYQLTAANAIWAQQGYPWRPEFKDLTQKYYGAGLREVDYAMPEPARQTINKWVEDETREKVKELIPQGVISNLTRMVLANAIYFKGDWAAKFKKEETKDQPFHLADGTKADAPLMTQTGTFGYGEFTYPPDPKRQQRGQVLELPYAGKALSMLVLLPGAAADLPALEAGLTADALPAWGQPVTPQRVRVFLPRFKAEKAFGLNDPLQALGMKAAFSDATADFTGMHTGQEKLYISAVLHKAFVDVNEEGTEAAAATGVAVGVRSVKAEPKEFRADRPFLFLIRENKTGAVLFLGRLANPKG